MNALQRTVLGSIFSAASFALLPTAHADDFPKNIIYVGAAYLNNHPSVVFHSVWNLSVYSRE